MGCPGAPGDGHSSCFPTNSNATVCWHRPASRPRPNTPAPRPAAAPRRHAWTCWDPSPPHLGVLLLDHAGLGGAKVDALAARSAGVGAVLARAGRAGAVGEVAHLALACQAVPVGGARAVYRGLRWRRIGGGGEGEAWVRATQLGVVQKRARPWKHQHAPATRLRGLDPGPTFAIHGPDTHQGQRQEVRRAGHQQSRCREACQQCWVHRPWGRCRPSPRCSRRAGSTAPPGAARGCRSRTGRSCRQPARSCAGCWRCRRPRNWSWRPEGWPWRSDGSQRTAGEGWRRALRSQ